jgi:poly(A) polymerase
LVPPEALKILRKMLTWPDIFLVGGGVRDILMDRELNDLDLALPNPEEVFSRIALSGNKHGIILGEKNGRPCYRFVIEQKLNCVDSVGEEKKYVNRYFWLDLVKMQGGGLLKDLAVRDFALNAMALPLRILVSFLKGEISKAELTSKVIDPHQGLNDIGLMQIRAITPDVFRDDPLRLWRLWRFAAELHFAPHADLVQLASDSSDLCLSLPGERIRAELYALLRQPETACFIAEAGCTGLLEKQFPAVRSMRNCLQNEYHYQDVWDHSLQVLSELEKLILGLKLYFPAEGSLGVIYQWLNENNNLPVLKLAALLHDIGKPLIKSTGDHGQIHFYNHEKAGLPLVSSVAIRLRLSKREADLLAFLVERHMQVQVVVREASLKRQIRFWRTYGIDIIGLILLGFADLLAKRGRIRAISEAEAAYSNKMTGFLDLWCYRVKESFREKALLDGTEIIELYNIDPGPLVGYLKEAVREAQADGTITTKEDAKSFISLLLNNRGS